MVELDSDPCQDFFPIDAQQSAPVRLKAETSVDSSRQFLLDQVFDRIQRFEAAVSCFVGILSMSSIIISLPVSPPLLRCSNSKISAKIVL